MELDLKKKNIKGKNYLVLKGIEIRLKVWLLDLVV